MSGATALDLERFLEQTPEGTRIRGTRIDLATVVEAYLDGSSPEEIAYNYPTASLEAVYAAITYYLANRSEIDGELAEAERIMEEKRSAHSTATVVERLRALRRQSAAG